MIKLIIVIEDVDEVIFVIKEFNRGDNYYQAG